VLNATSVSDMDRVHTHWEMSLEQARAFTSLALASEGESMTRGDLEDTATMAARALAVQASADGIAALQVGDLDPVKIAPLPPPRAPWWTEIASSSTVTSQYPNNDPS